MNQWFRFYHEALDDPKVQRLDPVTFKHWVNLLCLAARNEGRLPSNHDVAFALRIDEITLETLLERLLNATLIDVRTGGVNGSHIAMHGWAKRQYKSDTSTERVKRFRKRSETVTVTAPDTESDTDTELPPNPQGGEDKVTPKNVVDGWNNTAEACELSTVRWPISERRMRRLKVMLRQYPTPEPWRTALNHIRETPFLRGENPTGWKADFEFFLQAKSFEKMTEESYGRS